MAHAQDSVNQVELQLFNPGEPGQLVLDQGLLGRAVHGLDPKTAQARTGTRGLAQLDKRRCLGCRTAGMGMAGVSVSLALRFD
ncbi:hypothetical protein D9M73_298790 [compost metagenome]